jgi:hypothetical protein
MKIDLGQINPGAEAKISIIYTFESAEPSTTENKHAQLIALQDQDGHFKWGDALLDLTGKTKEEWTSMRPKFERSDDLWITAIGIIFLMLEDNTEAATLKARGYLSSHSNEKKAAKLIEKAFLKLKPLVPGLEGKEQLFMRQHSETPSWKRRLAEAGLKGAVGAVVSAAITALLSLL